jgi:hypothetical protein
MRLKSLTYLIVSLYLMAFGAFLISSVAAEEAPKMTKEELRGVLDHPDVVVLDVRYSESWQDSDLMIKGATRGNPANFDSWADEYPKEKTLVLY